MKNDINTIVVQLTSSIDIGYDFAMDSFTKKANRSGFGEYYYNILNISITHPYSYTQNQNEVKMSSR